MLILRSAVFNSLGLVWTVLCVLAAMICLPLPGSVTRVIAYGWMVGVQGLLRHVVGLSYEVRGRSNRPQRPAIYAFKHQSACHNQPDVAGTQNGNPFTGQIAF